MNEWQPDGADIPELHSLSTAAKDSTESDTESKSAQESLRNRSIAQVSIILLLLSVLRSCPAIFH